MPADGGTMIPKPRLDDFKVVGLYTGKVLIGIGLLMLLPAAVSLVFGELAAMVDFLVGAGACFVFGLATEAACQTTREITWSHGMVVVTVSWFFATVLGAIPHWLSGHFGSYLDAMFDLMSGYTTTGLYLIQDLDHISYGLNTWRHLLSYAGGQGIIVVALTFLFRGTAGAYAVYVGEGKDERLLPNVVRTARAIWLVSLVYLVIGSAALLGVALSLGQPPVRAALHSVWVFMAAWSTGGFAPQSYNIGYYHSHAYEAVTAVLFIIGSLNFALHWAVWTGNRSEALKNIEVITFTSTVTLAMIIVTTGLTRLGVYPHVAVLFRKMFYHVASGHTTTGFGTIYSRELVVQWGPLAMLGITMAMALGASACSTGGGFKALRVGLIFKGLIRAVRQVILPESAHVTQRVHHIRTRLLDDGAVRTAMVIVLSYAGMYAFGTLLAVYFGYDTTQALFDAVSAGSNTGLSCGVTSPSMPAAMKAAWIVMMWAGRLEFMSLFATLGFLVGVLRGR